MNSCYRVWPVVAVCLLLSFTTTNSFSQQNARAKTRRSGEVGPTGKQGTSGREPAKDTALTQLEMPLADQAGPESHD